MTDQCDYHPPALPVKTDAWSAARGVLDRIAGVATGAMSCVYIWQQRAAARRHLASLSDHMLKDIGVGRAEVDRESRKPFWQG